MKTHFLIFLLACVVLSACSHHYYIPITQNVPMFKEKNEIRASASLGGSGYDSSIDLQAAYAITNNLAIMSSYMNAKEGHTTTFYNDSYPNGKLVYEDYGISDYLEGAIGYYKEIDKNVIFEIYGGYGNGHQQHQYVRSDGNSPEIGKAYLTYYQYFAQPSLAWTNKNIEFAISSRFTNLSYREFRYSNFYYTDNSFFGDGYDLATFLSKRHFLVQPATTLRVGWENIKFQFQYQYSYTDYNTSNYIINSHFSFGLFFSLTPKSKKIDTIN